MSERDNVTAMNCMLFMYIHLLRQKLNHSSFEVKLDRPESTSIYN
jgi:hypothetical protein